MDAWHTDAMHAVWAERVGSDCSADGGIYYPGEAQQNAGETVFRDVVPGACDKGLPDYREVVQLLVGAGL